MDAHGPRCLFRSRGAEGQECPVRPRCSTCVSYTLPYMWLQYRSAPTCGDLTLLHAKDWNPALQRCIEETSPGTWEVEVKAVTRLPWVEELLCLLCEKLFHLLLMLVMTRAS